MANRRPLVLVAGEPTELPDNDVPVAKIGGLVVPLSSGYVLAQTATTVTAGPSSAAEVTLFTYALPAGLVAAGDVIRVILDGDLLQNTAAAQTITPRFKFGATTVFDGNTPTFTAAATRRKWHAEVEAVIGSTAEQRWKGSFNLSQATSGAWTSLERNFSGAGITTEDTTAAKNIVFTTQLSANHGSFDMKLFSAAVQFFRRAA